jgi:GNAT superfamily N-acetyltransferase
MAPAYALFRRSLWDYLLRIGLVESAHVNDDEVAEAWSRQGHWIEHLWATAAENWVAETPDGRLAGWALTTERDGHLELTHFFVDPEVQERGTGRRLLEVAFPPGRPGHRGIMATQDARALGLYLRFGVGLVTTSLDFVGRPEPVAPATDLVFERLGADDAAVEAIASVEREVIGHRRDADIRFLLAFRPAWAARRAGRVVGFAFGTDRVLTGPMAALDPADVPALLALVENEAAGAGVEELIVGTPLANRAAVDHLLARRFRIDPFFVGVLADDDTMRLDRWIHTGPMFIV